MVEIKSFGPVCALGEGPLWDVAEQRLYWVDSAGKAIYRVAPDGGDLRRWQAPGEVGAIALREGGGAVVTIATGIYLLDFETGRFDLLADLESDIAGNRMNDGKVDRDGRFIFGSFDSGIFAAPQPRPARGRLYCMDEELQPRVLLEGVGCTNGPAWSPDGSIFYFSDTWSHAIAAYPWDRGTGTLGAPQSFVAPDPSIFPDGATVDEESYLWSTACGVGELRRYAPDGTLDRVVELPITRPTSVMFGGVSLDILFVTSMSIHGGEGAGAGMTHAISGLGVRGIPERRFNG